MMTAHKECSKKFELDTVVLVVEQRHNWIEASQESGHWFKESEDDANHAFRVNGIVTPEQSA